MYPDDNTEDGARKETQEFDPSFVGEEGIHPKQAVEGAESVLLEQEQRDEELDENLSPGGSWQTFKTP